MPTRFAGAGAAHHPRRAAVRAAAALAAALAVLGVLSAASAFAAGDYGPDTCLEGWVWRGANAADHVCVTGAVRDQTAYDNSQAAARRDPNGGPYGPDTCLYGWVWREAFSGDHVCVTGATRSQAAYDNSQASARRDSLAVWHTTYTIPPQCDGDICTSTSTDDLPHFRLQGDHINTGWIYVELRRLGTGARVGSWWTYAGPAGYTPGGRFSLDTGVVDCRGGVDSYFQVRDPSSTRWSAPHYVSANCYVL